MHAIRKDVSHLYDSHDGYSEKLSYYVFEQLERLLIELEFSIETFERKKLRKVNGDIKFFIEYFDLVALKSYVHEVETLYCSESFIHIDNIQRLVFELKIIRVKLWEESFKNENIENVLIENKVIKPM